MPKQTKPTIKNKIILKKNSFEMGLIYDAQGSSKKAIDYFKKTITSSPNYFKAYIMKGRCESEYGSIEKAFVDFTKAIKIMESKKDKKLRTLIAYAYAWRGQLQENKNATLEDYNKAIALDPLPEITGIIYEDCFARIAEDLRTGQDQIMYALDCPNVPLLRENLIANS